MSTTVRMSERDPLSALWYVVVVHHNATYLGIQKVVSTGRPA